MRMLIATSAAALREAWSNRRSFWVQVIIMVLNDVAFVVFWFIFFAHIGSVRGWDRSSVMVLYSILAMACGLTLGIFDNSRRIAEMVTRGELDSILALPVEPLPYLLVRRVHTAMLGDMVFGPVLFLIFGHPTPERLALFLVGSVCGAVVMVSFLVMIGSLSLFNGGKGAGTADLALNAILIVASYPIDLFGGAVKLILFTLLPAALVAAVPAQAVNQLTLGRGLLLVGGTMLFVLGAWALFRLGLGRYRSGAQWVRA